MNATELRVKVAEAMGWTNIAPYRPPPGYKSSWEGVPHGQHPPSGNSGAIPNFGAPDWSATGAVLDEIERRGWGCHTSKFRPRLSSTHDCSITTDDSVVEVTDPCRHVAICLAFLEAHARAKEPK